MKSRKTLGMFAFIPLNDRNWAAMIVATIVLLVTSPLCYICVGGIIGGSADPLLWVLAIGFGASTSASVMALVTGEPAWVLIGLTDLT